MSRIGLPIFEPTLKVLFSKKNNNRTNLKMCKLKLNST